MTSILGSEKTQNTTQEGSQQTTTGDAMRFGAFGTVTGGGDVNNINASRGGTYSPTTNNYSIDGGLVQAAHQITADAIDANTRVFSENIAFAGDTFGKAIANNRDITDAVFEFIGDAGSRQDSMFQTAIGSVSSAFSSARTSETSALVKSTIYGVLGLVGVVALITLWRRS